jgi:hypothetical protein
MRPSSRRAVGVGLGCLIGIVVAAIKYFVGNDSVGAAIVDGLFVAAAAVIAFEIVVALSHGERRS